MSMYEDRRNKEKVDRRIDNSSDRIRQSHKKKAFVEIMNAMRKKQYIPNIVQRYLIIGSTDYTRKYKDKNSDLDTLVDQIFSQMLNSLRINDCEKEKYFNENFLLVKKQIKKWVIDDYGTIRKDNKGNSIFGIKRQIRSYKSISDAAKAIYGWVSSKPNRHKEKEVANFVYDNSDIRLQINTVFGLIKNWINNLDSKEEIINELNIESKTKWADYNKWFNHNKNIDNILRLPSNLYDVICEPSKYTFRANMAVLHDLMKYFMPNSETKGQGLLQKLPELKATIDEKIREGYKRPPNSKIPQNYLKSSDKLRKEKSQNERLEYSKEEEHSTFIFARKHQIPMWGRHSYTAARMMTFAQQVGANQKQISAVAWGIMAFWRKDYDHRTIPYHTLHEIMDFLPDFGGTYDPLSPYNGLVSFIDVSTLNESNIEKLANILGIPYVFNFILENENLWENKAVIKFFTKYYSKYKSDINVHLWTKFAKNKLVVIPVLSKKVLF